MKKIIITFLMMTVFLFSCEKTEYTGDVKFVFHLPSGMGYSDICCVEIYTAEISQVPIYTTEKVPEGILKVKNLLQGNYFIKYDIDNGKVFQVVNGKETVVDLNFEKL